MIIDAGGGTVDISSYAFLSKAPVSVEEVVKADCMYILALVVSSIVSLIHMICRSSPGLYTSQRQSREVPEGYDTTSHPGGDTATHLCIHA